MHSKHFLYSSVEIMAYYFIFCIFFHFHSILPRNYHFIEQHKAAASVTVIKWANWHPRQRDTNRFNRTQTKSPAGAAVECNFYCCSHTYVQTCTSGGIPGQISWETKILNKKVGLPTSRSKKRGLARKIFGWAQHKQPVKKVPSLNAIIKIKA